MFDSGGNLTRRVIPRWHNLSVFLDEKGFEKSTNFKFPIYDAEAELHSCHEAWKLNQNKLTAVEYLAALTVCNKRDLKSRAEVAEFLRSTYPSVSFGMPNTSLHYYEAQSLLNHDDSSRSVKEIRFIRERLRRYARNPLLWLELAREYTLHGLAKSKAARRAVQTATSLAPHNRYVLRCAARYYIHIGDPENAAWLLERSKRTNNDPWLASTLISSREIAKIPQRRMKSMQLMLSNDNWSNRAKSELASVVGSIDINDGNIKSGKKLFRTALADPNENVLAQALWVQENKKIALTLKPIQLTQAKHPHEARAIQLQSKDDWLNSDKLSMLKICRAWQNDEPYSSRPAITGSNIALAIRENIDRAKELLENARNANPDKAALRNNLAFAYAVTGKIEKANQEFKKILGSDQNQVHYYIYNATQGLLHFRSGNIKIGREHYEKSIRYFEEHRKKDLAVKCKGQLALEEINLKNFEKASALFNDIVDSTNENKSDTSKENTLLILKLKALFDDI